MDQNPLSIDSIFLAALEIASPVERTAYLEKACRGDLELRKRVERLLAAHPKVAGSFLESPPSALQQTVDMPPIQEGPGTVIGPFKLLQKIGEGGFGVVYMAEQQRPVQRKVALKVIKPGMDTREVVARFEVERQALALMDHPNIARVFDAGATESGRPYFVMELVRGVPITDYCDQNGLTFRERLELFMQVCLAVQHAHQKAIIHRDVKPNNVLVTLHDGKPVVKVIDFGVAKAIDRRLTEKTLFTRYAEMIGTPLYMSPEQAEMSGLDVDTRTDIYSLGVLLYELLTGSTPFDRELLGKAAYDEIRRIIREEEPLRPSIRVSTLGARATAISGNRKIEPHKFSAELRGDLDWIVMKALEKDRTRRYDTAKDFADDIQHYLHDQPVEARAPSSIYRFRKLVRRYRIAAVAISAVASALAAATVFSGWMAISARQARDHMQAAMLRAEQAQQQAEAEAEKARKAAADAALSLEIIGAAMGESGGKRLGNPDQSVAETLDAVAKRLDASPSRNYYVEANLRPVIGKAYEALQKHDVAEIQFRRALEAQEEVYGAFDVKTIDTLNLLVTQCYLMGRHREADDFVNRVLAASDVLGGREGGLAKARGLLHLADSLRVQGNTRQSLTVAQASYEAFREHGGSEWNELPWVDLSIGQSLWEAGDTEAAIARLRQAHAGFQRTGSYQHQWAVLVNLGNKFLDTEKLAEARDTFERALQIAGNQGPLTAQRRHEGTMAISNVLSRMEDWEAQESLHREFLRSSQDLDGEGVRRAEHQARLIASLVFQGKDQEATALQADVLRQATPRAQGQLWNSLGIAFFGQGLHFQARDALDRATRLFTADDLQLQWDTTFWLSKVHLDLRDAAAVETVNRNFLETAVDRLETGSSQVFSSRYWLAISLNMQGKDEEAKAVWLELASVLRRAAASGKSIFSGLDSFVKAEAAGHTSDVRDELNIAREWLRDSEPNAGWPLWKRSYWNLVTAGLEEKLGRRQDAIRHAQLAMDAKPLENSFSHDWTRSRLVQLLSGDGQHAEAEDVLRQAIAEYEKRLGDEHVLTNYVRGDLAEFLIGREEYTGAEELLGQAERHLVADARVPAPQRRRILELRAKLCEAEGRADEATAWRAKIEQVSK